MRKPSRSPSEESVVVVLSTALITARNSRRRADQYLAGLLQWFRRFPDQEFFWVDNTIASADGLDSRFLLLRAWLPEGHAVFFDDNGLGIENKGAGVISQLKKLESKGVFRRHRFVLFHEPRQKVLVWATIQSLISRPSSAFRVETVWKSPYLLQGFSFTPNFYTGTFMIDSDVLLDFLNSTSAGELHSSMESIEQSLYSFFARKEIPFKSIFVLWVRRTRIGGKKEYR